MIKRFNRKIKKVLTDHFWRNVITLFSGTLIAQAIPLLLLPLITRLYSKEAIGFYFVYLGIGFLTQIVVSLQYQLAIVLSKEKKDTYNLLIINFITIIAVSVFIFFFIVLFHQFISGFIKQKEFADWLYFVPLSAFLLGMFNSLSYFFNREKEYKVISTGKIIKSLSYSVVQIVLGLYGIIYSGLIIGLLFGQLVSVIYLLYKLFFKTDFTFKFKFDEIIELIYRYRSIPFFNTSITFLNTLSNQLPIFFIAKYYGNDATGDYGIANRVVSTPLNLVSSAVGQVFFQEASVINNNNGDLMIFIKSTLKKLFKIGIIPVLLFWILAPTIFTLVFGEGYLMSAKVVQIIIPWVFIGYLTQPISSVFTILKKQKFMLIINGVVLLLRYVSLLLGYFLYDEVLWSIAFYTIIGVLFNIFQLMYFIKISKHSVSY